MDRRAYQRAYKAQQRERLIARHRCIRCQSPLGNETTLTCSGCITEKKQAYQRKKIMEAFHIVKFPESKEICHGWYVGPESKLVVPWTCPEPGCGKVFTQRSFQKKGRLLAKLEAQEESQGLSY